MALFKCKMCGGTIEFEQGATVGICDSCGSKQTLPRLDDDKKANLYDRANHFRRNNDFDKAMSIYEQILNEDNTDAEAYWSIVLCRYGIEYVDDPSTHKKIPTVNRAQFTSIYMDEDYKSAIKCADIYQKTVYEEEAKVIDNIQKGILEISSKEEPFDIFICYKETDASGRRTQDSVLAQDLYYQLTQEGYKVFFSRITLEDKLGAAYEPYIFAALNSSKVMVAVGTQPEYFQAVWVKNEWSRYLGLIKNGEKKVLIPAYRDMDPYNLPEEFSHLQAQDMSKLGFMQDLVRGIKKILDVDTQKQTTIKETVIVNNAVQTGANPSVEPLLKRVFIFLEEGNFSEADAYCERVLDLDPECGKAYLGKLMVEYKINQINALENAQKPLKDSKYYNSIIKYGDEELINRIDTCNSKNTERLYNSAKTKMANACFEDEFLYVSKLFKDLHGYADSMALFDECIIKAEESRKESVYTKAINLFNSTSRVSACCEEAKKEFNSIIDYKDSRDYVIKCDEKIKETNERDKNKREKIGKTLKKISLLLGAASILIGFIPYVHFLDIYLAPGTFIFSLVAIKKCKQVQLSKGHAVLGMLMSIVGLIVTGICISLYQC